MNSTQLSLVSALSSAKFFQDKNPELAKIFQNFALEIYNNPKLGYVVIPLLEQGFINKETGELTYKGFSSLINNPKELSPRQLSMNTKSHLLVAIERNILTTKVEGNVKKPGVFSYMPNDAFRDLVQDVMDHLFDLSQEDPTFYVTESTAAYINALNDVKVEDMVGVEQEELNVFQPTEVTDIVTEEVVMVEAIAEKTVKAKSKKVKA
jgi:hypothetical protein